MVMRIIRKLLSSVPVRASRHDRLMRERDYYAENASKAQAKCQEQAGTIAALRSESNKLRDECLTMQKHYANWLQTIHDDGLLRACGVKIVKPACDAANVVVMSPVELDFYDRRYVSEFPTTTETVKMETVRLCLTFNIGLSAGAVPEMAANKVRDYVLERFRGQSDLMRGKAAWMEAKR